MNVVFRDGDALVGDNLEGAGVVETLRREIDPAGKHVVLLGAGRLARATAVALAAAGAAGLTIVNRTASHADALALLVRDRLSVPAASVAWQDEYAVPPEADVLIHAANSGPDGPDAPLPLSAASLAARAAGGRCDLERPANLASRSRRTRGCKTIDGLSVFIEQAAIGLRRWTGVDADRLMLREAAEEFLGL